MVGDAYVELVDGGYASDDTLHRSVSLDSVCCIEVLYRLGYSFSLKAMNHLGKQTGYALTSIPIPAASTREEAPRICVEYDCIVALDNSTGVIRQVFDADPHLTSFALNIQNLHQKEITNIGNNGQYIVNDSTTKS